MGSVPRRGLPLEVVEAAVAADLDEGLPPEVDDAGEGSHGRTMDNDAARKVHLNSCKVAA